MADGKRRLSARMQAAINDAARIAAHRAGKIFAYADAARDFKRIARRLAPYASRRKIKREAQ